MSPRTFETFLLCALFGAALVACGDGGGGNNSGSGGTGGAAGSGLGGNNFNQCGVAAPLPADTGQCTAVTAPAIADFDDFAGTAPEAYGYYINGEPPTANALQGGLVHVGDGSNTDGGAAVVATEMVVGEGGAGYALQISNTNAMNWGGLLMFYFVSSGTTAACVNANGYRGVELSIRGTSPTGRFGVTIGMLDTTPVSDKGLCANANADDCKSATLELALPADATTWAHVQVPWSALTPGVGSGLACVPVTGQNIVRLVIQPFMKYPPPNFMLEPGPYTMAVDNLGFY
jgi:hypothetical protein